MLEAIVELLKEIEHGELGSMPSDPDNLFVLNYAGGNLPTRSLGKKKPFITEPQIQLRIRNKSYYLAFQKMEAILNVIEGYSGDLGGENVKLIKKNGEVMYMGRDENNRAEFSINLIAMLQKSDS